MFMKLFQMLKRKGEGKKLIYAKNTFGDKVYCFQWFFRDISSVSTGALRLHLFANF